MSNLPWTIAGVGLVVLSVVFELAEWLIARDWRK